MGCLTWGSSQYKHCLSRYRDFITKIKKLHDHLIIIMRIPILVTCHFYVEMRPEFHSWGSTYAFPLIFLHCQYLLLYINSLGHVTHICISKLTIIGSDNGLLPGRCQAIIWTNAVILLIAPLGTNFSEILIEIYVFLFKKMHFKMSSGNWWPFCLGLNVLTASIAHHTRNISKYNVPPFSTLPFYCGESNGHGRAESAVYPCGWSWYLRTNTYIVLPLQRGNIIHQDFPDLIRIFN